MLAQTGSAMLEAGVWLRARRGVPLVCVNTIHLPSVYKLVLPEALYETRADDAFREHVIPWVEQRRSALTIKATAWSCCRRG